MRQITSKIFKEANNTMKATIWTELSSLSSKSQETQETTIIKPPHQAKICIQTLTQAYQVRSCRIQ